MAEGDDVLPLPRFFKVFFSASSSESLAIPLSFVAHLEDPLPQSAKLQGSGGKVWTVGFAKRRENAYFTDEWSKFVEENTLKDGEFLTFVYDGHCTFEVSVFGRCSCKEIRAEVEVFDVPDSESEGGQTEEEEEKEDTSLDIDDLDYTITEDEISLSTCHLGGEETETDDVETDAVAIDAAETEETETDAVATDAVAIDAAETEETETDAVATDAAVFVGSSDMEVVTNNPCFDTVLKNRMYELLIPAETVRTTKLNFGEEIRYIDKEGTLVGLRGKWADDRMCFKGWDRICRRNRIKPEDVVTCELLHHRNKVHSIKIHIKRGVA